MVFQVNVSLLNGASTPAMRSAFRDSLVDLGADGVVVRHNDVGGILTARFVLDGPAEPEVARSAERLVQTALEEAHIPGQVLMLGATRVSGAL
jgi:hypothetical protein